MITRMSTPLKLGSYGASLLILGAGGYLLGGQVDTGSAPSSHSVMSGKEGSAMATTPDTHVPGLAVSEGGYSLELPTTGYNVGRQQVSFRIKGPDGTPVTRYDESHEKQLHLIAVRRDFSGFQHVHPTLDPATGTWSVGLDLTPGAWRVFTDFVPTGADGRVLAGDILVPGDPGRRTLPAPRHAANVDGFTVTATGSLAARHHSMLDFTVTKDGRPVTDLQPYLGAYGHLVALREGDLAYLHVHPDGEPGDGVTQPGPSVGFGAEVPTPGRYHLFLDFQVDGTVHTAPFTLDAQQGGPGERPTNTGGMRTPTKEEVAWSGTMSPMGHGH